MNTKKNSLVSFYFGALEESERLLIEKQLLQDPEVLLDYLDLKRDIESAAKIPQAPSDLLWHRLSPLTAKKNVWYVTALTGAVAAMLAFIYISSTGPQLESTTVISDGGILFDSAAEHSFAADVL